MNSAALTWPLPLHFDPERTGKREKRVRATVADQPRQEPRLLCAACRALVTYPIHRFTVQGNHEHVRTNPQGITYRIGCFREACGCTTVGETTKEFAWFPGYGWRIGLCTQCRAHLGWRFDAPADHFYGLILDRLVLDEQPANGAGPR